MNERGLFIVLEGLDNSGKTTQSKILKAVLEERGLDVVQTREPGGTEPGEEIRQILLKKGRPKPLYPMTQSLLFYSARVEFLNDVVVPNLSNGVTVITDRFDASTYAYQGYAQGASSEMLDLLYRHIVLASQCRPDVYAILDIPVEESRKRLKNADNDGQTWAYEEMGVEFAEKVRTGYLEYAKGYVTSLAYGTVEHARSSAHLIDGMQPRNVIHDQLMQLVDMKMQERQNG